MSPPHSPSSNLPKKPDAFNRFDFHRDVVQKAVKGLDARHIRFRTEHNPVTALPQYIQDGSFIISLAHTIGAFLLGEFVLCMYSTHAARLLTVFRFPFNTSPAQLTPAQAGENQRRR